MAKQSGLGAAVIVDDSGGAARTISNDVHSFDLATPVGVQDITGVDKSAMERLLLLVDYSVTLNGIANFASNLSHDVFRTVTSTRVNRTTAITVGSGGGTITCEAIYSNYRITRADSGELTWVAEGALADGTAPAWT